MARIEGNHILPVDPRTTAAGAPIPVTPPEAVAAAVARARRAQADWAREPLDVRKARVRALGERISARAEEVAAVLVEEIGKPPGEAWTSEVVTAQELFQYWLGAIDDALADVELSLNPLNYPGKRVVVRSDPLGVIALIMPWNYPFHLPLRTLVPALLAGDAVVLKPSEHAARTGALLGAIAAEVLPEGLVTVVQGGRAAGEALIDARPDKVVFTGSVATGRAVAVRAAHLLIPVALELGSKDPAIVLADADLERAAQGIAWGAFHNAGQDCASVERCYVHRSVYDAFVEKVVAIARSLRPGTDLGPLVNEEGLRKVRDQVDAAVAAGARVRCGGAPTGEGWYYPATVITDVPADSALMTEETFGPVLPVVPFDTPDEAVALANASTYGLCASVWTRDLDAGRALVDRVVCGVAYVNNCCFTGPMGGAAWSGRRESGSGVTGSRFMLDGLVAPRTVCVDRSGQKREVWWYPYGGALVTMARGLVELNRSGGAKLTGARLAVSGLLNRWKQEVG